MAARDNVELSEVPANQEATHEALLNWARWCGSGRGGSDTHPMFRGYTPYLYPEAGGTGSTVDTLGALAVQRAFVQLPEKHRLALRWWYCYPWLHIGKVQRSIGATKAALAALVNDARQMVANTMRSSTIRATT